MQNTEYFVRMEILYGREAMERLARSRVALLGVGGVGGHCAEAMARSGIGHIALIDGDCVAPSNINRQAVALHSTIGHMKTDVMRTRLLDINPAMTVESIPAFYVKESPLPLFDGNYDLIVDAIDDIPAKVDIAKRAEDAGIQALSCMGAGNKTGSPDFRAADLYETDICPLARAMRKAARSQGVSHLRVLYSRMQPAERVAPQTDAQTGKPIPGSVVFVTGAAGLALAGEAVRMLLASASAR